MDLYDKTDGESRYKLRKEKGRLYRATNGRGQNKAERGKRDRQR